LIKENVSRRAALVLALSTLAADIQLKMKLYVDVITSFTDRFADGAPRIEVLRDLLVEAEVMVQDAHADSQRAESTDGSDGDGDWDDTWSRDTWSDSSF